MRPLAVGLLMVAILGLAPPHAAADGREEGGDGEGYCVTITPDHPPFVFIDPSRCELPDGIPP